MNNVFIVYYLNNEKNVVVDCTCKTEIEARVKCKMLNDKSCNTKYIRLYAQLMFNHAGSGLNAFTESRKENPINTGWL